LKQTIEGLRSETQNLKDIIVSLCTSSNRDALIRVVHDNLVAVDFERGLNEVAEVCRRDAAQNSSAQNPFGRREQPEYATMGSSFTERPFPGQSAYAPGQYVDGTSHSPTANPGWAADGDVDEALDGDLEDGEFTTSRTQGYNQDGPWRADGFP
jgi:hypothetical protein